MMITSGNTIPRDKTVSVDANIKDNELAELMENVFDLDDLEILIQKLGFYSHTIQVPVGEWVPFFWGTAYANGSCTEEDAAGNCAEGARLVWDEWKNPELRNLTLRIWRSDESYDGPIYIDHLTLYSIAPLNN